MRWRGQRPHPTAPPGSPRLPFARREILDRGARGRLDLTAGTGAIEGARCVVRVGHRLGKAQHRREADVGPLEQRAPFFARSRQEKRAEAGLQRRPLLDVVLRLRVDVVESEFLNEERVELRFERADLTCRPSAQR